MLTDPIGGRDCQLLVDLPSNNHIPSVGLRSHSQSLNLAQSCSVGVNMGGPVEISGDQLRSIVERVEHIEEEIKELNGCAYSDMPRSDSR
jgi:Uncharacterized protein conserved in bacteria (DUF2312)